MRWGGLNLRVVGAILLAIFGGRRGPEPARAEEPVAGKGTLVGVVRSASGPAAGAKVAVYRHDVTVVDRLGRFDEDAFAARYLHPTSVAPSVPEATTDKEGRFRLEGLPVGTYEVLARAADGTGAGRLWPAEVTQRARGARGSRARSARDALGQGDPRRRAAVRGTVFASFESDGTMVPLPHGGIPTRIAADGTFRFDALPSSPYWVYAVAPGRAAVLAFGGRFHGTCKPGSRVDLIVDAGEQALGGRGRGRRDARRHPGRDGAVLLARGPDVSMERGDDGRRTGRRPCPGGPTCEPRRPATCRRRRRRSSTASVTLEMRRGRTVRGVVRGPDRAPVAGVPVHVVGAGDHRVRSTRSGPTGAYEVAALPAAALGIVAFGDGWVPADALALAREPSGAVPLDLTTQDAAGADLSVVRGASARILVQSNDGKPIPGATVSAGTPSSGRMGTPIWMTDVLRLDPVVAAADGVAELRGLLPGYSYGVRAAATGYVSADGEVVPAIAPVATLTLTLDAGRTITVLVREKGTGAPIPDATVLVWAAPKRGAEMRQRGEERTGVDGRVSFEGLPRTASAFAVEAPRHVSRREDSHDIAESDASTAHDLALEIELVPGLRLAGRLRRADGKPLYIPSITAEPVEASGAPSDRPWRTADVGEDGVFLLEGLAPGLYRLECTGPSRRRGGRLDRGRRRRGGRCGGRGDHPAPSSRPGGAAARAVERAVAGWAARAERGHVHRARSRRDLGLDGAGRCARV